VGDHPAGREHELSLVQLVCRRDVFDGDQRRSSLTVGERLAVEDGLSAVGVGRKRPPLAAVALAAPLTRVLAVEFGLGVIVAAAVVGLAADQLLPTHAAAVYCGTFVGMASPALFPALETVTAAGLVAGVVFVAAQGVFDGFGGKLGTTAFVGCAAVALLTGAGGGTGTLPSPETVGAFVIVGTVAAVPTYWHAVRLDRGAVEASALVGLVAGLLLPAVAADGPALAAVAFCASFAGMVSPTRLPCERSVALAGGLCGLLVAATSPVFVGAGGKLGTIAFTSCLLVRGLLTLDPVVRSLPVAVPTDGLGTPHDR
jgi:hypothetical protein